MPDNLNSNKLWSWLQKKVGKKKSDYIKEVLTDICSTISTTTRTYSTSTSDVDYIESEEERQRTFTTTYTYNRPTLSTTFMTTTRSWHWETSSSSTTSTGSTSSSTTSSSIYPYMGDPDGAFSKRNKWWKNNKDKLHRKIRIRRNNDKKWYKVFQKHKWYKVFQKHNRT